jgi:hypothetical protein
MLITKPQDWLLSNLNDIKIRLSLEEAKNYALSPPKGFTDDPSLPPKKYHILNKQAPAPEKQPKFIRHSNSVEDIHGAKSRDLYIGVARNILDIKDIDGSKPKKGKKRDLHNYNMMNYADVNKPNEPLYKRAQQPMNTYRMKST